MIGNRHPSARVALLAALALLLAPLALPAQGPGAALVRDINTAVSPTPGVNPSDLVVSGNKIYFLTDDLRGGFAQHVAVTDGTAVGTELLADPCDGAVERCQANPELLGGAGGLLFYTTTFGEFSDSILLWRSDGTRSGTYPLTDLSLSLDSPSDQPGSYALAGGRLFFRACDEDSCAVWVSDGTVAGTRQVKPIVGSSLGYGPTQLTALGNRVYFFASGADPWTLWASDGNAGDSAGTRAVQVFAGRSSSPRLLTAAGGRLFFVAGPTDDADELWTSDGTPNDTRAVTSFEAPHPFFFDRPFKVAGSRIYFYADDVTHGTEIWTSDGTPGGTRRVTEFGFDTPFPNPRMELLGSRLVFFATDGLHPLELWSTTGTPASTAPVAQVNPQPASPLLAVGSRLLFVADDPTRGTQLWTTDGTTNGTRTLFSPCAAGACGTLAGGPVALGGAAFFQQRSGGSTLLWRTDGTPAGTRRWDTGSVQPAALSASTVALLAGRLYFPAADPAHGEELWSSDGTAPGTRQVTDLQGSGGSSNPDGLTALSDRLFFTATDGHRTALWQSSGGAISTPEIPVAAQSLTAAAGLLFFTVVGPGGNALWRTDGNAADLAGTLALTGGGVGVFPGHLAPFAGKLVFAARQGNAIALWQSDGTPGGTTVLVPLPATVTGVSFLTALGSELYFTATDTNFATTVWRSDGTAAGTRQVSDSIGAVDPRFTRFGAAVFFLGFDADDGFDLWRTDGTRAGTASVFPAASFDVVSITDLVVFGNALYFFAPTRTAGHGLWKSDGTADGTTLVREVTPQIAIENPYDPPPPAELTVAAGRLFLVADDGEHGRELWVSDGTAAGTTLFADLFPGFVGSDPSGLYPASGRLYFSANDGVHGRELWSSDGTAGGTRLVADVNPGGEGSEPRQLTAAGGRLYWSADDGLHGREPWSLPLAGISGCPSADTRLCLAGNRFQVEVVWRDFQGNSGVGHAVALTADTGYFWFFASSNVELVVKVLDARSLNQAFWVFYGALSNVEYTITVTDTQTGLTRRYFNPAGNLASVGDTRGFGPLGAADSAPAPRAAAGGCAAGAQRLCLNGGRFAVTAAWKDFSGHTGTGTAVPLTADTGYFWFFNAANVEVVAKVLDGHGVNGKFWLFYGALSNVEYTLTVTDTQTGAVKTYKNPSGQFGNVADTGAF